MRKGLVLVTVCIGVIFIASGYVSRSSAQLRIFSHNTKAHKTGKYANCASCHTLPTTDWTTRKVYGGGPTFPAVATFPYHNSCFGCHTKDIYRKGGGGAFCGTCHTEATMRARAVGRFPVRAHPTQFTTLFPHNVHQDIIASNRPTRDYAVA